MWRNIDLARNAALRVIGDETLNNGTQAIMDANYEGVQCELGYKQTNPLERMLIEHVALINDIHFPLAQWCQVGTVGKLFDIINSPEPGVINLKNIPVPAPLDRLTGLALPAGLTISIAN